MANLAKVYLTAAFLSWIFLHDCNCLLHSVCRRLCNRHFGFQPTKNPLFCPLFFFRQAYFREGETQRVKVQWSEKHWACEMFETEWRTERPENTRKEINASNNFTAVIMLYCDTRPEQTRFKFLNFLIKMISRKYKKFTPRTCSGPVIQLLVIAFVLLYKNDTIRLIYFSLICLNER